MRLRSAAVCRLAVLLLVASASALPGQAVAGTVFGLDDFNGGLLPNWSSGSFALGVDTTPSGENFLGIAGDSSNFGLSSGSVTLTVPTADPHTSVTLTFREYVIRSMDGDEPFSVSADGTDLINPDATFSNLGSSSCTDNTTAGCTNIKAINAPAGTVGPTVGALLFPPLNSGAVGDTFYDLTLTFPHTAANLSIIFSYNGQQGLFDESWGLDRVTVATNSNPTTSVPEPATLTLLGTGLIATAALTKRRARRR